MKQNDTIEFQRAGMVQVKRTDELSYSVPVDLPPLVWVTLPGESAAAHRQRPLVCPNCGATMYDVHLVRRCLHCYYVD